MISDCGSLERVGSVGVRHADLFARVPRIVIDHHASNQVEGDADWVDPDAAATCEMVTLLAVRLGVPLDIDDGAMATALMGGIVMDTATFAHPNATPRTLAVSAALRRRRRPALGHLAPALPDQAGHPAAPVRARPGPDAERGRRPDRLVDPRPTRTSPRPARSRAHSEGIIDLLAQAEDAEVAILFKEDARGTRLSVRTRPGGVDATVLTGAFGGGGHARAAGATLALAGRRGACRPCSPRRSASSPRSGADDGARRRSDRASTGSS